MFKYFKEATAGFCFNVEDGPEVLLVCCGSEDFDIAKKFGGGCADDTMGICEGLFDVAVVLGAVTVQAV